MDVLTQAGGLDMRARSLLSPTTLALATGSILPFLMPDLLNVQTACAVPPDPPEVRYLTGIVRDFRPRSDPQGHPDMERDEIRGGGRFGLVEPYLDADGKPVYRDTYGSMADPEYSPHGYEDALGNIINPALYDPALSDVMGTLVPGKPTKPNIDSAASFYSWYRDVPGVNLSAPLRLEFRRQPATDIYIFDDKEDPAYAGGGGFFPINGQLFGNYTAGKNFHFTFELESEFVYKRG